MRGVVRDVALRECAEIAAPWRAIALPVYTCAVYGLQHCILGLMAIRGCVVFGSLSSMKVCRASSWPNQA